MVVEFIVPKSIDPNNLNATVDWRNGNGSIELVTPVKNQRFCSSCWAFATVGAFEAAHAKATGKLVSLSEQNLLDCDNAEDGCIGAADMENPFKFVLTQGYLDTENAYSYVSKKGSCNSAEFGKRDQVSMSMVHKIYRIAAGDEQALKAAVALHGPVMVAIAANDAFIEYNGDSIFDKCNDEESSDKFKLNHAILLVGYGTDENGADYWLIKNSFSEFWGNEGYGKIARNRGNKCGIASEAIFVE